MESRTMIYPVDIHKLDLGIYLVAGTAVINWILGAVALRQGKKNQFMALQASGRHLQTDTYSTAAIMRG
jgi:divalent metal cation (Fe/Co/Zn/Cd) transporter